MMSKMKSSNLVYWKTLIILPVIMLALALSGSKASSQTSSGKDVTYTGKIIDSKQNEALPGAHIVVKGTTIGTTTDDQGMYKITAPEGCTLVASFVGYETVYFDAKKSMMLTAMKRGVINIEETTITPGSKINKDRKDIPDNVLVIVDGKEVSSTYLKTTDPNTIESMNVLKDETATKKYGDKGKNGVILITTKKADKLNPQGADVLMPPPPPPPPPDSSNSKEPVFFVVEESATFQGGDLNKFRDYVQSNVKYPDVAVKNRIQGKVMVQFVVNHNGEVTDVKVLRGIDKILDLEALEAIKSSPKWVPGKQGGKSVAQLFTIPVAFKLK